MKTGETHSGMIEFGLGVAAKRGEWAYFACCTVRGRLQVFDRLALLSLFLSPAKDINTHYALRTERYLARRIVGF